MWCWRKTEKIGWTDLVKYEEVLHGDKKSNILNTIKTGKSNRIGHTLSWNCLQKHITKGKIDRLIEIMGGRGRRCKQILDEFRETRDSWKLEKEDMDLWLDRIRNELMNGSINQSTALSFCVCQHTETENTLATEG
jgi:hypothetical protein